MLGSQTYTQPELLNLLGRPTRGDASLILARQLIAAKLNIASGADPLAIALTVAASDAWLAGYGGKLPYNVPSSSIKGLAAVALAHDMDLYNNGDLPGGPDHCEDTRLAPAVVEAWAGTTQVLVWTPGIGSVKIKSAGGDRTAGTADDRLLGSGGETRSHEVEVQVTEPLVGEELIFAEDTLGARGALVLVSELVPVTLVGSDPRGTALAVLLGLVPILAAAGAVRRRASLPVTTR